MLYCEKCWEEEEKCKCTKKHLQEYTRVTEVLEVYSGLSAVDKEVLKKAGDRGTNVHLGLKAYTDEGLEPKVSDESYKPYVRSAMDYVSSKNFIPKIRRFFDKDLLITGECDAIYHDGHDLVLVDFKTSYKESKTWRLQGSAYAFLARKAGYDINRVEFLHLNRTGRPAKIITYEEDFPTFLKCLEIHRFFEKKPERTNAPDELEDKS